MIQNRSAVSQWREKKIEEIRKNVCICFTRMKINIHDETCNNFCLFFSSSSFYEDVKTRSMYDDNDAVFNGTVYKG